MDAFAKQLVDMVRQLPDDAILDLVKNHLDGVGAPEPSPRSSQSRTPQAPAPTKSRRTRGKRRSSASRAKLEQAVLAFVHDSDGVAVSEVAAAVGAPKTRVAPVLRTLRDAGTIHQAGDRRFARYGKTKAIAKAASNRARKG